MRPASVLPGLPMLFFILSVLYPLSDVSAHDGLPIYSVVTARYDYTKQTGGRQWFGEFSLLRYSRDLLPGLEIQMLTVGGGQYRDSSFAIGRWRFQLTSYDFDRAIYEVAYDSSGSVLTDSAMTNSGARRAHQIKLGASGGLGLLDLDRSQKTDRHFRWVHIHPGVFAQLRSVVNMDIRLQCMLGLSSYKLGDVFYGSLGPPVLDSYTGFEGNVAATARLAYRRISVTAKVESTNIFAGKTVNFIRAGAMGALIMPHIPVLGSWVFFVKAEREHTYFNRELSHLDHLQAGVDIPLFPIGPAR